MTNTLKFPAPQLQIEFAFALKRIKSKHLQEALFDTVRDLDIPNLDRQLASIVDKIDLATMARYGLRAELLFPVPLILEKNPHLLGYYRLLMGYSQKEFYGGDKGFGAGKFKAMEEKGIISKKIANSNGIKDLCQAFCQSAAVLLRGMDTLDINLELLKDLTILTVGPQLRGGANNTYGTAGIARVFGIIQKIVTSAIVKKTNKDMEIINAAGRKILIKFASDPDIIITEKIGTNRLRNIVAIEVKSGTDVSNIHNRIGEAEKSHQKAKKHGFTERWTVVNVNRLDMEKAKSESPSTDRFYLLSDLMENTSSNYEDFSQRILSLTGIA